MCFTNYPHVDCHSSQDRRAVAEPLAISSGEHARTPWNCSPVMHDALRLARRMHGCLLIDLLDASLIGVGARLHTLRR